MNNNSIYNPELLEGRYCPQVIAYYFKEWNNYNMSPGHAHNQVEIMYIIGGICIIQVGDESFEMKKGEFILIDANVRHNLIVGKDRPCRILNVEFRFIPDSWSISPYKIILDTSAAYKMFYDIKAPYVLQRDLEDIYPAFKNLVTELDGSSEDNGVMVQLLLSQIMIKIARLAQKGNEKSSDCDIYILKTIKFIQQNYDADIKVEDIAKVVNLHPVYLQRIFKASQKITLSQYLMDLRVEKAKMLLKNTDIPIIDLSGYVGISSRQYFSYIFKKKTGMTPQTYRRSTYPVNFMQ